MSIILEMFHKGKQLEDRISGFFKTNKVGEINCRGSICIALRYFIDINPYVGDTFIIHPALIREQEKEFLYKSKIIIGI